MAKSILRLATVVLTGMCLTQTGSAFDQEHFKEDLKMLTEARPFSVVNVLVKPQARKALDLDASESEKVDQLVKHRTEQWTHDWAEDVAAVKARLPVNKVIQERLEGGRATGERDAGSAPSAAFPAAAPRAFASDNKIRQLQGHLSPLGKRSVENDQGSATGFAENVVRLAGVKEEHLRTGKVQ